MFDHFKSDLFNNMDNMRILGVGPSSVIRSKSKGFQKVEYDVPKHTFVISFDYIFFSWWGGG